MTNKLKALITLLAAAGPAVTAQAQQTDTIQIVTVTLGDLSTLNLDSIELEPSMLFMPLIFDRYESFDETVTESYLAPSTCQEPSLYASDELLDQAIARSTSERRTRYHAMVNNPENTRYNMATLPEPPEEYEITADPTERSLTVEPVDLSADILSPDEPEEEVKVHNWLHSFDGSVQFSQAYLSENWYQGGNNNLNVIGNFLWNVSLNTNVYPNLLFDTSVQYKVGISSAPDDSIRGYSISEDLFQVTSKFGYKAIAKWYYSVSLVFKTQFLNNYESNTNEMTASLLSPGELNVGLGMTYSTKNKDGYWSFDASISPLSYNMKVCRDIDKLDPTDFGIDEGRHFVHDVGSTLEGKMVWNITPAISWTSRIYAFTNYTYVQGDWENTFNFSVNRYLSTQFYLHLRYDRSATRDVDWKYWQMKEILSFGLSYKFSMQ